MIIGVVVLGSGSGLCGLGVDRTYPRCWPCPPHGHGVMPAAL